MIGARAAKAFEPFGDRTRFGAQVELAQHDEPTRRRVRRWFVFSGFVRGWFVVGQVVLGQVQLGQVEFEYLDGSTESLMSSHPPAHLVPRPAAAPAEPAHGKPAMIGPQPRS